MKNLKFLILTILLVSFAGLYGCYTQVATDDGRYSRKYHERDYEDSYGQPDSLYGYENQDTSYYPGDGAAINNYYLYGDDYRPFYRRYYWGYHPGFSISLGWNSPWYAGDPWGWAGWYDNYYYGDPFFYSSYYYNYPYFYPPYYGSYWGPGYGHYYGWGNWGNYKYRSNDFTRLRNNDGGRGNIGLRNRDLISPTRGSNRVLYKTRTQGDSRNTVTPRTRQGDQRTRDQQGTLRKGNNNTPNQQRDPAVTRERQRTTNQGTYQRPRNEGSRNNGQKREGNNRGNSERKRSNYYNYYWPNQQQRGENSPQYNPPRQQQYNAPRRESRGNENRSYNPPQNRGGENRSYNPPQSRSDGGSRGGGAPQSRNSGGNDNGRRR